MGDKENCTRGLFPDLQQKLLHIAAGLGVQGAERLVHQASRGPQGQGAGNRHALLHTAGKRFRIDIGKLASPTVCSSAWRLPAPWPLRPSVILMDEPFGALDAQTRSDMQQLLLQIWEETACTILFCHP